MVAAFSMLPCLLGEVFSYHFKVNSPRKLIDESIQTIFFSKEQGRSGNLISNKGVFLWILQTLSLRAPPVAAYKDQRN